MQNIWQSRLASALTIVAGAWLLVTPLIISMTGRSLVSILITGGVIALAGIVQLFWVNTIPSWINAVAAVWLFVSAFVFTVSNAAAWNEVIVALVTLILAAWDGTEISDVRQEHRVQVS